MADHPHIARIAVDVVPALVLLAAIEAEVAAYAGDDRLALAALAALVAVPLAARRRFPLPAHATILVALGAMSLLEPGFESVSALLAIVVSMASVATEEPWPTASVAAGLAGTVLALGIARDPSDSSLSSIPPTLVLFVFIPMAAGLALRRRQRRVDDLAVEAADAGRRERHRIARELHDVVSHGVSVMVIQAQAAQRLLDPDPVAARESLAAIEITGRRAMGELRQLLGLLRAEGDERDDAGQPGMVNLPALAEVFGASGLDVRVRVVGTPGPLDPGLDGSAYRIVHEALTNALRHGRGGRADVVVTYADARVGLEVSNEGDAAQTGARGFGLAGMRERVSSLGGTLQAGPQEGGRFVVRASLPR